MLTLTVKEGRDREYFSKNEGGKVANNKKKKNTRLTLSTFRNYFMSNKSVLRIDQRSQSVDEYHVIEEVTFPDLEQYLRRTFSNRNAPTMRTARWSECLVTPST